jgi:hypothetical protein
VAGSGDRQEQMVMDGILDRTPKSRLDRSVTCMDLVDSIGAQILFNMIEDQKMDLGPTLLTVQKELLGKHLVLRIVVSKGFLLLAIS